MDNAPTNPRDNTRLDLMVITITNMAILKKGNNDPLFVTNRSDYRHTPLDCCIKLGIIIIALYFYNNRYAFFIS